MWRYCFNFNEKTALYAVLFLVYIRGMNIIDLQIQSTASDGKHTPSEIVAMARDQGLKVIAITDHDTTNGIEEGQRRGRELGIRVIPGIEISVEEYGAHILGYGIDYKNEMLCQELEKAQQARINGAKKMVENLQKAGFAVTWDDVVREAYGPTVARPHIARAILNRPENKEKLGNISNVHEFVDQHLSDASPNYVHRAHISAKDAILLIHGAGGVAVWSHPIIHFRHEAKALGMPLESSENRPLVYEVDYEKMEDFLGQLVGWGLDGLEVFNPSHREDDAEYIEGLVIERALLRTAGSDFHEIGGGTGRKIEGLHPATRVGDYETHGFSTEDIVIKLDAAIEKQRGLTVSDKP